MPIALNRAAMARLANNDEMELTLPNGVREQIIFDRIEDHGGGIRSSIGYLKDKGKDYRVLITSGPNGSFGSIRTADTAYRILPGDGHDWLVDKMEESVFLPLPSREPDTIRMPANEDFPGKKEMLDRINLSAKRMAEKIIAADTPADPARIDLMVVYTTGLANRLGPNLMTRLFNLVAATNMAYSDSQVQMTLRLVNATMVNYSDATSNSTALNAITPVSGGGVGVFANIESIRAGAGADLVALLRNGSDFGGSGVAWLATSMTPSPLRMYSVTTGCVVGCDSVLMHEMGHNMGNAHDRATDAAQGDGVIDGGVFSYSFGHYFCASGALTCNPNLSAANGGCGPANLPQCSTTSNNNVGTIMSYFDPVTLKFSNPNIMCAPGGGGATSQPCGVSQFSANSADNALSMNTMRNVIQNMKTETIPGGLPGLVQLSAATYTASEAAGTVNITVNRLNGSTGAIAVSYTTTPGTAKAGFDYTTTSGTLNWANGDSAAKTISIPLVNDGVTEGGESFTVTISNPTGATGVYLGNQTSATVQLTEPGNPWPPGGTFPAGYTAPGMANGAWALASDCNTGDTSCLRSPRVVATTFGTFVNADLDYSGTFPAGTITFDYRVSSYPSYGIFDFLIDNVVVFTNNGGESGWLTANVPITAGAHTIRWRYRNSLSFFCSNAVPAPPGGSNCADRAWIDNVVFPPTLNPSSTALSSSTNPSFGGQSITLTATVTGGAGTAAGVVTFRDGGNVISGCNLIALSSGTAQCMTSSLPVGTRNITAEYSGNTTYDVSTSTTLMQTVNPGSFQLSVSRTGSGTGNVTSNPAGINTGTGTSSFTFNASTVVTLTAAANGGSTFTGWAGAGCSGTGTCVVTMNAATSVTATFDIVLTAPGAPTIGTVNPGNGQAIVNFTAPASDGGSPITSYTATCNAGGFTGTGSVSPITVNGLTNGVTYNCSVTATNAIGTSAASATGSVTPSAGAPVALVSVFSRKVHGAAGPFELEINSSAPVAGAVTVEPRAIGSGHLIVFRFSGPITSTGTVALLDPNNPFGGVSAMMSGNDVLVTLTGVPDNRRARVTLTGVNGTTNAAANMGFLVGDVGGNRAVTASDIAATKARVGLALNANNYLSDLNVSGSISGTDVSTAKARSGLTLP
ncbi:MAG: Ig-like domain repeat protein [Betaproteobacteria bacterium]|nr:Ig-like domain repeat protein [Betaproteobacteria bacterium]